MQVAGPTRPELDAVAAMAGRRARVVRLQRLHGGSTSSVHQLTIERADGHRMQWVLRRVPWREGESAAVEVKNAADMSTRVAVHGVPVPRVVHVASRGLVEGAPPALVMVRAPGRVNLTPVDAAAWLAELARVAATIHDLPVPAGPFVQWSDPAAMTVPQSATRPDLWRAAIEALRQPAPDVEQRFIHRDYQHFNLLWRRGRISAVVDWGSASRGPVAVDVGHCRLNLAVLFSAAVAEDLLRRYVAETGRAIDPWWDLQELLQYDDSWPDLIPRQVAGRVSVDTAGMTARVEDAVLAAMRRLG